MYPYAKEAIYYVIIQESPDIQKFIKIFTLLHNIYIFYTNLYNMYIIYEYYTKN